MSANTIPIDDELRKFLQQTKELLDDPKKDEDACYVALYHISNISEALKKGDESAASILCSWMAEEKEKFRFCATDDDFYKLIDIIKNNIDRVLDNEIEAGPGSGVNLGKYLRVLTQPDPFKKKN